MDAEDMDGNLTAAEQESVRQLATKAFLTLWFDLQNRVELAAGDNLALKCRLKRAAARALALAIMPVVEEHCPEALDFLFSEMWRGTSLPDGNRESLN